MRESMRLSLFVPQGSHHLGSCSLACGDGTLDVAVGCLRLSPRKMDAERRCASMKGGRSRGGCPPGCT